LRKAQPGELTALRRLASSAHGNTRFAKDPGFPRVAVRRLYSLWLAKAARKGAVQVPAGRSGSPAGYIVCEMESGRRGRVGLLAVSPRVRGRGLGRELLCGAEGWFRRRGAREMRAVTQGLSVQALRMYEGAGFRVARVQVWFHRWFQE
jgi:ribosomal protein S18 acetylase RimI-like enzyme